MNSWALPICAVGISALLIGLIIWWRYYSSSARSLAEEEANAKCTLPNHASVKQFTYALSDYLPAPFPPTDSTTANTTSPPVSEHAAGHHLTQPTPSPAAAPALTTNEAKPTAPAEQAGVADTAPASKGVESETKTAVAATPLPPALLDNVVGTTEVMSAKEKRRLKRGIATIDFQTTVSCTSPNETAPVMIETA